MRRIKIFDTTLRDGEQSPGCSMYLPEKIEVATALEAMGVDVIEAGFPVSSADDFEAVSRIADTVKNASVTALARALENDIRTAYDAVKAAVSPRIHLFIATADVHMKYKLKMTPEQVRESAYEMTRLASSLCGEVEFSAEDATRSDRAFLASVLSAAVKGGARIINIPDTVGYACPDEMKELISFVKNNVDGIEKCEISVHCHDDLGLAVANSLAAVSAGATQIECAVNGIGERAGNAALEEVVMALKTRERMFDRFCRVDTTKIYRVSKLVSSVTGTQVSPNKAIVGANAFSHESGIHQHGVMSEKTTYEIMSPASIGVPEKQMVLGKHSGRHAFADRLAELGYSVSQEHLDIYFERFKALADKKKHIHDNDIVALISEKQPAANEKYRYSRYVINCGNDISATATVTLVCNGETLVSTDSGDGPIDAAFRAVNKLAGEFVLQEFRIKAVTEGKDAQGEANVRLSYMGKTVIGRGVSTDIIEAGIKAYINGVNRLLPESDRQTASN